MLAMKDIKDNQNSLEPPPKQVGIASPFALWYGQNIEAIRGASFLPSWGNPARQFALRRMWYDQSNFLTTAAMTNLSKRIQQTPWQIEGAKSRVPHFQDLFQNAAYGKGFDTFISQLLQEYQTLDTGVWIELVGSGEPDTPLTTEIVGMNVLDGLRCYATGNDEFPLIYQSYRRNVLVPVHYTRVHRMVDSPSPDPAFAGMGLSAMSRAASVSFILMLLQRHQVSNLDEAPANGFIVYKGIFPQNVEEAKSKYEGQRSPEQSTLLHNMLEVFPIQDGGDTDVKIVPFSQLPANYNFQEAMQIYVNELALAIGVDPQDIFPLASGSMGSAMQSHVLHRKGEGKAYGQILTELERLFNKILPRSLEFKWKPNDTERTKAEAENAQLWVSLSTQMLQGGVIDNEQAVQLLANNVEAFADVLFDENGGLRLPDDDPKSTEQIEAVVVDDTVEEEPPNDAVIASDEKSYTKAERIRNEFEAAIGNLFQAAVNKELDRRRFGINARALISRYGRNAYLEALAESGIERDQLTEQDMAKIAELTIEQSKYVTDVGIAIYQDDRVSPEEAAGKPQMWFNKSIMPFYQAGKVSADRNGIYEWRLGATEQHCKDCQRLNGQVHRLSNWVKNAWLPQSSKLACGGFRCDCSLKKTRRQVTGSY